MRRLLIIYTLLPLCGLGQRITNLNLIAAGAYVGVQFTITKGSACSGYTIYHSLDSLNFTNVYDYLGVCGSSATDDQKSFTHSNPTPGRVNYYRVKLQPVETSNIARIYVVDENGPYLQSYPNPLYGAETVLTLRLLGTSNTMLHARIYNQFGKLLREQELQVQDYLTSLGVSEWDNGIYLLRVNDGQRTYTTKFNIQR